MGRKRKNSQLKGMGLLLTREDTARRELSMHRKLLSPDTKSAHLDLRLPAPTTVRNKLLLWRTKMEA